MFGVFGWEPSVPGDAYTAAMQLVEMGLACRTVSGMFTLARGVSLEHVHAVVLLWQT
jgi:hypothetical protein